MTAAGLEARIVPSVRAKAGPLTLGITAVVDPEKLKALRDPSLDLLTVKPIDEALPAVLAALEKDTQIQVLLVQGPPSWRRPWRRSTPASTSSSARRRRTSPDPPREAESLNGGKTLLVTVGQKGKYVGVVGVFDDPEVAAPLPRRVMLEPGWFDGDAGPMKEVVEKEYRETLKAQKVVENFPRHDFVNAPSRATFVGADNCKSCHANTYRPLGGHQARPGVRVAGDRPEAERDVRRRMRHLPHDGL